MQKIYTPKQVANILQVNKDYIYKLIKNGNLKASRIGVLYRIKESDVYEYMENNKIGGTNIT